MGTFGIKIEQNDLVQDIIADFKQSLKRDKDIEIATSFIIQEYSESLIDEDEAPLVWLAVAKCQWDYGLLSDAVLSKVKADIIEEKGLTRWKEAGNKLYLKRLQEIKSFIAKLDIKNPSPKKFPKLIIRKPIYSEGDCLSVKLSDSYYAALLVLKEDHSKIEYGQSLVILLDYYKQRKPELRDFKRGSFKKNKTELPLFNNKYYKKQGFLDYKYHLVWLQRLGMKSVKNKVEIIGNIDVKKYRKFDSGRIGRCDILNKLPLRVFSGNGK